MLEVSSQVHMRVKQERMKGREYRDGYNGLCAPKDPRFSLGLRHKHNKIQLAKTRKGNTKYYPGQAAL